MILHVMHVPGVQERERSLKELSAQADLCVHNDPDRLGPVWNWSQVLKCMASQDATSAWHVQVNDDVIPLHNWEWHLEQALAHSPALLLGLAWVGTRRGDKAFQAGKAYAKGQHLPAGCAVAYHQALVKPLARFAHALSLTGYPHDDAAMTIWAKHTGHVTALTSRSLFGLADVPSLTSHARYRTSVYTIETSPTSPAWDSGSVTDNSMGARDDEDAVLRYAVEKGWSDEPR